MEHNLPLERTFRREREYRLGCDALAAPEDLGFVDCHDSACARGGDGVDGSWCSERTRDDWEMLKRAGGRREENAEASPWASTAQLLSRLRGALRQVNLFRKDDTAT